MPNVTNWLKNWVPWCWHQKLPSSKSVSSYTHLLDQGKDLFNQLNPFDVTPQHSNNNNSSTMFTSSEAASIAAAGVSNSTTVCDEFTGYLAVYRLMFATTIFFIVFGIVMIKVKSRRDPRVQLHNG